MPGAVFQEPMPTMSLTTVLIAVAALLALVVVVVAVLVLRDPAAAQRRVEFCFQTKAERHLPAALASMASKYLRELAMRALNAFWCGRSPGLRPTAGYPQDAKRFRADIAHALAELQIDDRVLWRVK